MTRTARLVELLVFLEQVHQKISDELSSLSSDELSSLKELSLKELREREYHEEWEKLIKARNSPESRRMTLSEHTRLSVQAEQYSKIMREETYWENTRRDEWHEAPPEFYDSAFIHLKPKLLPSEDEEDETFIECIAALDSRAAICINKCIKNDEGVL